MLESGIRGGRRAPSQIDGGQTMMTANATDFLEFPYMYMQGRSRKAMDSLLAVTNKEGPQARTRMGPSTRVRVTLKQWPHDDIESVEQPPNSR